MVGMAKACNTMGNETVHYQPQHHISNNRGIWVSQSWCSLVEIVVCENEILRKSLEGEKMN